MVDDSAAWGDATAPGLHTQVCDNGWVVVREGLHEGMVRREYGLE